MVKISLTRIGKRNQPHYRIVVRPARSKRDGKALEYIGYYNPRSNPTTVTLDLERAKYWLSVGAQPTDTVRDMLIKEKLLPEYKQPGEKSKKALKKEKTDAEGEEKKENTKVEEKPAKKVEAKEEVVVEEKKETKKETKSA